MNVSLVETQNYIIFASWLIERVYSVTLSYSAELQIQFSESNTWI